MNDLITRRRLLIAAAAAGTASLGACAARPGTTDMPPIVFVPGNGDTAALWTTTIWRFESNGWPRDRLHAIDMPYPLARDDDAKEQPGRSSTAEHMAYLAAEVKKVLAATGASKVALVGNSRGGYPIRNFIANGGGAGDGLARRPRRRSQPRRLGEYRLPCPAASSTPPVLFWSGSTRRRAPRATKSHPASPG